MIEQSQETPWVLVRVRDQFFGLPATHVREMADMPKVTRAPDVPDYVLGLITLRGQVIPTVDLRRRMGVATLDQDLADLVRELDVGEQEHLEQMQELEASIGRACGTSDRGVSHHCSLRRLLESPRSATSMAGGHLKRLDRPDVAFHARARAIEESDRAQEGEALPGAIAGLRTKELADLSRAFAQAREWVQGSRRQIVVVIDWEGRNLGLAVDQVESIERLKPGSLETLPDVPAGLANELSHSVGKRTRDDGLVLLLELPALFRGTAKAHEVLEESAPPGHAEEAVA
jgi:chemotaxis signal transduction protein